MKKKPGAQGAAYPVRHKTDKVDGHGEAPTIPPIQFLSDKTVDRFVMQGVQLKFQVPIPVEVTRDELDKFILKIGLAATQLFGQIPTVDLDTSGDQEEVGQGIEMDGHAG